MTSFERLRSLTRRGGILLWMLLAAYAWAPLASALPAATLTVVVPFCSALARGPAHQAPAPRSIALHFTVAAQAAGPFAFALPASCSTGAFAPPRELRAAGADHAAPRACVLWRRPAPRGPPAPLAST